MVNKKSSDVRFQLHIWNRLLEGRIALQKVVVASREFEKANGGREVDLKDRQPADEVTIKSVSKLLSTLVRLRNAYRAKSQLCSDEDHDKCDHDDSASDGEDNEDHEVEDHENDLSQACVNDSLLDEQHNKLNNIRNNIVEKWYEKTKIGTIPKKGYTALELPTSQLIANALKDKDRLIRRTQIDRSNAADDSTHPETFNDDDFYHRLLKEVISKDEKRTWIELQRSRYKNKRRADTKASKGRKIKTDLIPKLVNFMAPMKVPLIYGGESEVPDEIRNELVKSLFGAGPKQSQPLDAASLVKLD